MRLDGVNKAEKRFDVVDVSSLNIQGYGSGNDYPQRISDIVATSTSAKNCLRTYSKFIRGNGFKDISFYKAVINYKGQSCDTLLRLCSDDLSRYGGFALHVNYNILFQIVSVEHIPFEQCRLGIEDDSGYVSKIAININWTGSKSKKRYKKASVENTDYIDVFNPNSEIVYAQIEKSGDISSYKGQVLYVSNDGEMIYPTPIYDSSITDISTDEGLSNIRFRSARRGFLPFGMLVYRLGQKNISDIDDNQTEGDEYQSAFDVKSFVEYQGDMNACSIMGAAIENDEDVPQFVEFPTKNIDKEFAITKDTVTSEIYAAFNQDVFYRIRTGALGFSNEIINDAFNYYNAMTSDERILIEQSFKSIFTNYAYQINQTNDYSINPLTYAVGNI